MRYFKFRWNEARSDKLADWGFITVYHEVDEDFYPTRQLEVYDNGNVLKYDLRHLDDEFGGLADQSLEDALEDLDTLEISKDEFEDVWAAKKALNR
ncbi:MAG TPA: hypothetical protein VGB00_06295 [Pyrinomonadaceae bacterium]|jgi:hypothetical protein